MTAPLTILRQAGEAVAWLRARVTGTLQTDSRCVAPGDGFIAWPGAATDGRAHVADALARGATACLIEADGVRHFAFAPGAPLVALHGLKAATGEIASQWFQHPSQALDVLAVTGTNGKTSTTWWLAEALNLLSKNELLAHTGCAVAGTLGVGVPPALQSTGMTTPDPVRLHRAFCQFADQGLGACAIEASSIGLAEHRLAGTQIRVGVFTNFTQDHLDYHGSMADYWLAKRALFAWPGLRAAVINIDDPAGAALHAELAQRDAGDGQALDLWTVSATGPARIVAREIAAAEAGLQWLVVEGAEQHLLQSNVVGHYNVLNLLGVVATLRSLGVPLHSAVQACSQLQPVPGRMEQAGQVFLDCIVDVIPLSVAVKILDASLFDFQIGHTPVLPYEPLHGLLALRCTLVVLAQKELRPFQQSAGRQFYSRNGKIDCFVLDFFLHFHHLQCRKSCLAVKSGILRRGGFAFFRADCFIGHTNNHHPMPQPDKIFRLMEKPLVLLRHLRGQGCKILLAQPHHQKGSGNGIVHLPVLVPQGTVQRQSHQLTIIVVDDGDRVTERIAGTDVSTDCLLQGFQVRIDLDLLRVLSRCDLQHRQGVLFLFHAYPPQI